MATYTENYNLEMPDQNDFYNIDVQNQNMQKIDTALAAAGNNPELEGNVAGLVEKVGTTTDVGGSDTTGSVMGKLNNIITSSGGISETLKNGVNILQRMAVFTSNGTFTVPEGVSCIKVTAIAAGGNGGKGASISSGSGTTGAGGGGGGGAGDFCINKAFSVTPKTKLSITVGVGNTIIGSLIRLTAGSTGSSGTSSTTSGGRGGNGGSGSIGGGGGGAGGASSSAVGAEGTPGSAGTSMLLSSSVTEMYPEKGGKGTGTSGGDGGINVFGFSKSYGPVGTRTYGGGGGGASVYPFGNGGRGGGASYSDAGSTGSNASGYGCGGGGGGAGSTAGGYGGKGSPGMVIIEW